MSPKTLLRVAATVALIIGLVGLTGCAKSEESTKVGADGKGQTTITMTLDMSKLKGLMEMASGMGMGGGEEEQDDPLEELNAEKWKKKIEKAKGVTLVSAEQITDDEAGTHTLKVVVDFESLELLYKSGLIQGVGVQLEKLENGNYKWTRKVASDMAPDADDPEAAAMAEAMLGMFETFLADMEITGEITLPTAIVETSGEILGPNRVRWVVGFKDLTKPAKLTQTVVFGGEGINWKPFSVEPQQDAEEEEDVEVEELEPATAE